MTCNILTSQHSQTVKPIDTKSSSVSANVNPHIMPKDRVVRQLQDQVTMSDKKLDALAKLYDQFVSSIPSIYTCSYSSSRRTSRPAQKRKRSTRWSPRNVTSKTTADIIRGRDHAHATLIARNLNASVRKGVDSTHRLDSPTHVSN